MLIPRKMKKLRNIAMLVLVFLQLVSLLPSSNADQEDSFDVRNHLSTVSRYGVVKDITNLSPSKIPEGCIPIHINLVARHGTRSPTKKRMRELDRLASSLEVLLSDAKLKAQKGELYLKEIPAWLSGWQSPWKGKQKGGELISKGEDELYHLGVRVRERFPLLFDEEYHPDVYTIKATQVPRASASAVSFGMGLFNGKGNLGPGRHRAFAVTSESRASDILLRFYDTCETYKFSREMASHDFGMLNSFTITCNRKPFGGCNNYLLSMKKFSCKSRRVQSYRENHEPAVDKLKEPVLDEITSALVKRYHLNFTRQDTASLWFLCKQEASLLDITDQACGLFTPSEVSLLEWTDDLEVFLLKGYGKSINYHMGVPLLRDVVESMEQAIKAKEEHHTPGAYEKARLRFAHAETVVPFSCLLGLFLDGDEFAQIQQEQPLELPSKSPQRSWRGSVVAPFSGNNMLVLYSCPADNNTSKYFIQVLHNEVPVPMPGCNNSDFCPFEVFKEKIVKPHFEYDFQSICKLKKEPEPVSLASKSMKMFSWLFSQKKADEAESHKHKLDL